LDSFFRFACDLRNPILFVTADCPDDDPASLTSLADRFLRSSMSVDFFCLGARDRAALLPFTKLTNSSLSFFRTAFCEELSLDLLRRFYVQRLTFATFDLAVSKSLTFANIWGNGRGSDRHSFNFGALRANDTVTVLIRPDAGKLPGCPAKVVFVCRYLDNKHHCFHRIIPVDCAALAEDPELRLAFVALKVAENGLQARNGFAELAQVGAGQWDPLFAERFRFAASVLGAIERSPFLAHFVRGRTPFEVLDLLCPVAFELGQDEWRPFFRVQFGGAPVILRIGLHRFLVVMPDGDGQDENFAEILQQIDRVAVFSRVRLAASGDHFHLQLLNTMLAHRFV
jgi:hypothetical protein